MKEEIFHEFNTKLLSLNKNDPAYQASKEQLENKRDEDLDAVDSFEQNMKKCRKIRAFQDIDSQRHRFIAEAIDSRETKTILEFSNHESVSIKSFGVKKSDEIKVTTRYLSGKMLMFAKLSLMSFRYQEHFAYQIKMFIKFSKNKELKKLKFTTY